MAVAGRYTANCERVRPSSRVDLESGESPIRAANSIHGGREPTFASINRPVANARPTIAINKLCPTTKLTGGLSGTRRCVRQHWICPPTPCPVGASTNFSACGPPTFEGRPFTSFCFIVLLAPPPRGFLLTFPLCPCRFFSLFPWPQLLSRCATRFRWPLRRPTAIWDLKCLVSLVRPSTLSTPITTKLPCCPLSRPYDSTTSTQTPGVLAPLTARLPPNDALLHSKTSLMLID